MIPAISNAPMKKCILHAIIGHLYVIISFKFCTIVAYLLLTNDRVTLFVYLDGVKLSKSRGNKQISL